jgi:hypothetical protein
VSAFCATAAGGNHNYFSKTITIVFTVISSEGMVAHGNSRNAAKGISIGWILSPIAVIR